MLLRRWCADYLSTMTEIPFSGIYSHFVRFFPSDSCLTESFPAKWQDGLTGTQCACRLVVQIAPIFLVNKAGTDAITWLRDLVRGPGD